MSRGARDIMFIKQLAEEDFRLKLGQPRLDRCNHGTPDRRKMQRHQRHAQHDLLQVQDRAGNARHQKPSTSARSRCSSTTSTLRLERCCCHRLAMQRAAPSRPSQRAPTHECRTRSTESCSSADSACHSHSPQSAVPAVDAWMSTATIARLARKWAC